MDRAFWTWAALNLLAIAAGLLLLLLLQEPAGAQPLCGRDAEMTAPLTTRFGEAEIANGIVSPELVIRIFAAPDGATFTIVTTDISGRTCVVATGRDLDMLPPPAAGERRS